MKMFYFDPEGYGQEYFVVAKTEAEAIKYVLKYLQDLIDTNKNLFTGEYKREYKRIEQGKYKIRMFEQGQVLQSEIC